MDGRLGALLELADDLLIGVIQPLRVVLDIIIEVLALVVEGSGLVVRIVLCSL